MAQTLAFALAAAAILLFQFAIWKRLAEAERAKPDFSPLLARFDLLSQMASQAERNFREELSHLRQELLVQDDLLRTAVTQAAQQSREEMASSLAEIRRTVDEKLQSTLDARLGASFKLVSERLEQVHRGLGEMQTLASGVGDLKRVLTNVKTRGTWGEVQLGSLLDQILAPEQFERNVATTGTRERVEFAIRLPGGSADKSCWLPVDAKFPVEDYQRLMEASEKGDSEATEAAAKALEATVRNCARAIHEKYLAPPATTDFGILFLATEGLYAEAIRRTGLAESLQREYRVILTGPNTFAAILNSLQVGFRTLVIQRRSSEIANTLEMVKAEFAKYSGVLAQVKKKLQEASNTVERAETRTRVLQGRLLDVEEAPAETLDLPLFPEQPDEPDVREIP